MIKWIGTENFRIEEKTAVTIGKFDGIHSGHQKLLDQVLSCRAKGYRTAVFTFEKSLSEFFTGKGSVLTTNQEKEEYLAEIGIDILVEFPVNDQTVSIEPEEFIRRILKAQMNAGIVIAGYDCSYGYRGRGDFSLLERMGNELSYQTVLVEKELYEGREISSTYVRSEVEKGNMELVEQLLKRPYSIYGRVAHGRKLGRQLSMPTLNLLPDKNKLLPPFGVYMSHVKVGTQEYDGITNIGCKPTVTDQKIPVVETYLYDFDDDLYGENIEVSLLHYERPEKKFASVFELKEHLKKDWDAGEKYRRVRGRKYK